MNNLPGLNFQLGEDIDALRDAVIQGNAERFGGLANVHARIPAQDPDDQIDDVGLIGIEERHGVATTCPSLEPQNRSHGRTPLKMESRADSGLLDEQLKAP